MKYMDECHAPMIMENVELGVEGNELSVVKN